MSSWQFLHKNLYSLFPQLDSLVPMPFATTEYACIGGNRHSAAADWSRHSGQLAFGADQYVAIWQPFKPLTQGISQLLRGHTEKATAIRFVGSVLENDEILLSGSANGELCLWQPGTSERGFSRSSLFRAHDAAVNTIDGIQGSTVVATGGADALIKIWKCENGTLLQLHTINLTPRYIPLTLVLGAFRGTNSSESLFLAAGGTRNTIQVFALTNLKSNPQHELHATLSGHEGWVRSLALREDENGDILLASSSHDKYIRLWRLSSGDVNKNRKPGHDIDISMFEQTLTSKIQTVSVAGSKYAITFEALLLGHEDWIYSAAWNPSAETLQLLTASADGSLTIWEPDHTSGIWVSTSRLGEINAQKGATTATGSAGGFWTGAWSTDGQAVVCLGRTGSWRLWEHDNQQQYWVQKPGISGHVGSVNGIAWSPCGGYLLSTSSDQTTRLHAEWRRGVERTWHEFARPQIHGYDLNCVTSISSSRFVSGADEKLLRVFDEPKVIADILNRLCKIELQDRESLPDIATMPVLGLSNKPIDGIQTENGGDNTTAVSSSSWDINEPPTEDFLARHTLWPEHEKLYGHGYEISAATVESRHHKILATACKASSLDHAVIRLYDAHNWHEIKPPLVSHSLTVTRLAFSNSPVPYLLSVGRDRQWSVFAQSRDGENGWKVFQSNPKAHSRMILDCAWSPTSERPFFATAGRDKTVKIWAPTPSEAETNFTLRATLKHNSPVTAVSFTAIKGYIHAILATGEEDGQISVHVVDASKEIEVVKSVKFESNLCPVKAINCLEWRPSRPRHATDEDDAELAVASADGSVRVLRIDWKEFLMQTESAPGKAQAAQ